MGRKSSIDRLPPAVRKAIQAEITANRLTLDEIKKLIIDEFGEDAAPSRSALGRYKLSVEQQMQAVRESRKVAEVWAEKLGKEPESDIGKVVLEIIRTLTYQTTTDLLASGEGVDPKQLSQLARAMTYVESAGRLSQQRERELLEAARVQAANEAAVIAAKGGMSKSMVDDLKAKLLGINR